MDIKDKIKTKRLELGMTQEELARLTGYTDRSSIARIEKGKLDPPFAKLQAFADALNIPPVELMGLDNTNAQLNWEERALLDMFNSMSQEGKDRLFETAEFLSDKYKKELGTVAV